MKRLLKDIFIMICVVTTLTVAASAIEDLLHWNAKFACGYFAGLILYKIVTR